MRLQIVALAGPFRSFEEEGVALPLFGSYRCVITVQQFRNTASLFLGNQTSFSNSDGVDFPVIDSLSKWCGSTAENYAPFNCPSFS
jgi:hypothetical protein